MDALAYHNKTLIGNWYEDRLDTHISAADRSVKTFSNTPLQMKHIIVDQPFKTMNNVTYKHPNKHPNKSARKKKMITFQTLRHTIDTRREEGIPLQGYGSLLPQHTADKDMRILTTTAHSSFGGRDADDDEKRDVDVPNTRGLSSANTPAAGLSGYQRSLAKTGIKSGGLLGATGERLKVGGDGDNETGPKQHTFVQRSWMYDNSGMKYYQQKRGNGVPDDNVPGLMLKGLGTQAIVDEHNNGKSFKRSNDTIRDNLGIWYG